MLNPNGFFFFLPLLLEKGFVGILIEIFNVGNHGVGPKFFEIVSLAGFGHENVHEDVSVVDHNPFGVAVAVVVVGLDRKSTRLNSSHS